MNLCEAFKISNFARSPRVNGIIRARSNDEWETGFSRICVSDTDEVNALEYHITSDDLADDGWEPVRMNITVEPIVVSTASTGDPVGL